MERRGPIRILVIDDSAFSRQTTLACWKLHRSLMWWVSRGMGTKRDRHDFSSEV